jgi:soluble lytic murein transglycosylase
MKQKARTACCIFLAVAVLLVGILAGRTIYQKMQYASYPCRYTEIVERWAAEYALDPLLVYSFIRTESGFNRAAQSKVDARGLMQITQVTFDWIKSKIAPDEEITFDDLYDPEVNIRFGCYYLKTCLSRYSGHIATAAAAYHSGWGTVDALLKSKAYSPDGEHLDVYPYSQMRNYVSKIGRAYEKYQKLYA